MLDKSLNQGQERMPIWDAIKVMQDYMENGKRVTTEVRKAYQACSQLGTSSYHLMESIVGEEIAKEIVRLDNILNI